MKWWPPVSRHVHDELKAAYADATDTLRAANGRLLEVEARNDALERSTGELRQDRDRWQKKFEELTDNVLYASGNSPVFEPEHVRFKRDNPTVPETSYGNDPVSARAMAEAAEAEAARNLIELTNQREQSRLQRLETIVRELDRRRANGEPMPDDITTIASNRL